MNKKNKKKIKDKKDLIERKNKLKLAKEKKDLIKNLSVYKNLWCPLLDTKNKKINFHSWFNIRKYINPNRTNEKLIIDKKKERAKFAIPKINLLKSIKVSVYPTLKQKEKLLEMFCSCRKMKNKTIHYIKKILFLKKKIPNFRILRSEILRKFRDNLIRTSCVQTHILDYSIKDIRTQFMTCIDNIKKHIIKHFRIRYIKNNSPRQTLKLEPVYFSKIKNTFIQTILGDYVKCEYDGKIFDLRSIKKTCTLQYNNNQNRFYLFVPLNITKNINNTKRTVGIDLGIRTFATCYNVNEVNIIGDNVSNRIMKYENKVNNVKKVLVNKTNLLDTENNKQFPIGPKYKVMTKQKISKIERKYNEKITNLVNDLHWKTINYLLCKYDNVIIGKLSTHNIVQTNISPKTKDMMHILSFYKFTQRLLYKASIMDKTIIIAREHYTSKICTHCGYCYENNKSKIYDCVKCKLVKDRDINSARNMLIKYLK